VKADKTRGASAHPPVVGLPRHRAGGRIAEVTWKEERNVMAVVFEKKLQQAMDAVDKNLPANSTLVLEGTNWTQPALLQALKKVVDQFGVVADAKAKYQQQLTLLRQALPEVQNLYTNLGTALRVQLGKGHPLLTQFGVASGVRKPRTSQTVVLASAKSRMTRSARHTMGPRQRQNITAAGEPTLVILGPDGKPLSSDGAVAPTGPTTPPPASGNDGSKA
jgi:hypothetical protein